jgi:type II secretory pathway pseudopilin PulG
MYARTLFIIIIASLLVIIALVLAARYRMQAQRQAQRQLQQEADYQKAQLHQANEVVSFLQNFILERTEVMKKLNQSGNSLIYLSPHEWSEIERTLDAIDNNRFANLREQYPNMQEDDIRLCLLTRLGISNRTIGNIYCISISAVQHRKLKLKKDVFGESSPDITLEQILKADNYHERK